MICIFFRTTTVFAQIKLHTKIDKSGFIDCSSQAMLFVDSSAKISLNSLSQEQFLPLISFEIPKSLIKAYRYDYWLKLTVENPTDDTLNLLLTTGLHESTTLFRFEKNQFKKITETQERFSKQQRPFRSDDQYMPISFLPNTVYVFYAKINDYPREDFAIRPILSSKSWVNLHKLNAFYDEYVYLIAYGFLVSVLFFVALFVLMFYLLDRQIYYLYYAFYTISIGLFNLWEYEHSPYTHLIFNHLPFLKFTGNSNIYVFLTHIFYFLFIFEFLELKKQTPLVAKLFRWTIIGLAIMLVVDIFILSILKRLDWSTSLYWTFQDIFPILNFVLLFTIFKAKGRIARNIQVGSTFLMIGGLAGFLTHYFNNTPMVLFRIDPSIMFVAGTLLEVFFFSIAIGIKSYNIQKEQKSLHKSMMESELQTLRSQINPHFVFNSLNSIKSYILTHRSTEASEYLTDFSTLMRAILQYSKEQLISLSNELEIALLYVSLEKRRFEENFVFNYDLDPTIDTNEIMIPPMLLQPYIENAIKHGLMNKHGIRILSLKISNENPKYISIEIEDNGIGREQASLLRKNTPKYQSMGMSINDERINLLGQSNDFFIEIQIEDKKTAMNVSEGTKVIIRIPVE
ncbi:hypothetical protein GCM10011514_00100 [Emticicia aquatilis]|uniref:7TM diverse intracellular signalling n=2 Tax=Emticicia aquatilis TaxID=1537369 RepID=A0A916YD71_9BACT|nr:hypothetical protein GCM10011514_00100 [Emticicia aquatilis]